MLSQCLKEDKAAAAELRNWKKYYLAVKGAGRDGQKDKFKAVPREYTVHVGMGATSCGMWKDIH